MANKILKLQEMKANESKVVSRKSSQSNSCNTRSSLASLVNSCSFSIGYWIQN